MQWSTREFPRLRSNKTRVLDGEPDIIHSLAFVFKIGLKVPTTLVSV